eukprot:1136380-Pelagomonas_calceolata.AAC.1
MELPYLQQEHVQAVHDFLLQHNNKLYLFIYELMDIMLTSEEQSQADQPNILAEGPPHVNINQQLVICAPRQRADRPAMRWSGSLSGRDLAVPIGRNHTQSASPHFQPFHLPDACQLNEIVAKHISRVNPTSFPGFDTVLPSFLKYACKLVRREDGRGFHSINLIFDIECADAMCFPTLLYSHVTSCYPKKVENCQNYTLV